jgi:DNA primase
VSQGRIPEEVIHQIRDRADIETIISGYVALTRAGQNLKGLCPFHNEKTPSFFLNPGKQLFKCFGCGEGGDIIKFVMKREGLTFVEAVCELGRRVGVAVPVGEDRPTSPDAGVRKRLEQLNAAAAAWFRANLCDSELGKTARRYLEDRGIAAPTAEQFGLGLALPAWDSLLRKLSGEGYTAKEAHLAGLAVPRDLGTRRSQEAAGYYDRFRQRLMFPIRDLEKRIVAFGGRELGEGEPKYLNSSDTPLFHKGRTLYALDRAREAASRLQTLVIVEGYFDAIALHQAGITNVAATLGTAFTAEHIHAIRRFANKIVLLFDPDAAGVRAALRTLDLFVDSGVGVRVVSLPDGEDPDTFVRKFGAPAFQELLAASPSLLDFAVDHCLKGAGSAALEDRIRSVDEVLRVLQKAGNRIEKEECTRRVAERLGINQQRLIERYPELLPKRGRESKSAARAGPLATSVKDHIEERDLAYLLLQGRLPAGALDGVPAEAFQHPGYRRLIELGLKHQGADRVVALRALLDEATADPQCADLAVELSMSDHHHDDIEVHVRGCVARLAKKHQAAALSLLIARLRIAEQEGRAEEVRALNEDINRLRVKKPSALHPGV